MVAGCSLPVPKSWGTNLRDLSEQAGERLRERGGRERGERRRVRERCGKLRRDRECRPEEENERERGRKSGEKKRDMGRKLANKDISGVY